MLKKTWQEALEPQEEGARCPVSAGCPLLKKDDCLSHPSWDSRQYEAEMKFPCWAPPELLTHGRNQGSPHKKMTHPVAETWGVQSSSKQPWTFLQCGPLGHCPSLMRPLSPPWRIPTSFLHLSETPHPGASKKSTKLCGLEEYIFNCSGLTAQGTCCGLNCVLPEFNP